MRELLTRNSKIAKSSKRAYNFGIPAFRDVSGFATCPFAGACASGCYAQAGAYRFSNVAKAFQERLDLVKTNPEGFVTAIQAELLAKRVELLRVHDPGDFFSPSYLALWLRIARENPNVLFYAYTKSVQWVKEAKDKPSNFTFVFSFGGKQDHLIDRDKDRHSRVFESHAEMREEGYADTTETDDNAANPAILRIGLVYHGTKKIENTRWKEVTYG